MNLTDFFEYRAELLEQACDEHGFVSQQLLVDEMLHHMHDSKLIDSAEFNEAYLLSDTLGMKINAYSVSETGERLQLVIVAEETIDESSSPEQLMVSERSYYEGQLNRAVKFVKSAIKET